MTAGDSFPTGKRVGVSADFRQDTSTLRMYTVTEDMALRVSPGGTRGMVGCDAICERGVGGRYFGLAHPLRV